MRSPSGAPSRRSTTPRRTWELDRALCVQALADAFAWAWERPSLAELMPNVADPDSWDVTACWQWHDLFEGDVGQHADARLEHDPGALVDALCRFAASDALSASDHRRQVTWEKLYDVYVRRLHSSGRATGARTPWRTSCAPSTCGIRSARARRATGITGLWCVTIACGRVRTMEPLTEEEQKLRRFFEGQVVGAVTRRTGLVLAIEEGTTYNKNRGLDNIGEVAQWLCRATLDAPDGSAWHSTELESLVPLGEADGTGFPIVPVVGEVGRSEEDCKQAWCWALRMGYARDRVIAYARVKQAMLDVHNLSAGPELHTALFRVWDRANAGLREVELALKASRTAPRADPAAELNAMRTQWARTGEDVQNAQRQQPTLRCAPLVTGLTAREVGARAPTRSSRRRRRSPSARRRSRSCRSATR